MDSVSADLSRLELWRHPAVLTHASFKGIASTSGGPADVVQALVDAGEGRTTMLFPTLTYSPDHGPTHPPTMDVASSPCCTGAIPEAARLAPGSHRSLHPTHSITAIGGPDPEGWVADHEHGRSPCDAHSPLARLITRGGLILLLGGVTSDSNTTFHCLEELAGVPYHLQREVTLGTVTTSDGRTVVVPNRLHRWGWERDFRRPDALLIRRGVLRRARVGAGVATLIDAAGLREVLLPILLRDPLHLLTAEARARAMSADL